ncbi:cell wall hydrolase [Sphingomonas sp. C3-2]|uniref:cell wall hydrolase n=1 Tax=Sphingomonas sp. C3-2 TaxID=3062169 RepID=UPI00294B401A|nr:cell wall hydrolase [Sphingomonas sp. C3-2]WOK37140.1 cell wall hydrolase [Sphingomonas sp. C3-2]
MDAASLFGEEPPRADPLARALILAFGIGTVAAGCAVAWADPPAPPRLHSTARAAPLPKLSAPPPVEPLEVRDLTPAEAVAFNATIPFSTAPNPAARPFKLAVTGVERERATDCLAAAMLYEAGSGDPPGQRAVAQVVLNRLRHPAFPKTVCGVVFEGAERTTGCQFTFTCDGAMARLPAPDMWDRVRTLAAKILNGEVYRPVGHATHYHTDWVVPYWSDSLDKITAVGTHLFFRWQGWWGTPPAFRRQYDGPEPEIAKLAALSPAHAGAVQLADTGTTGLVPASVPRAMTIIDGSFIATLDQSALPESFESLARETCGTRSYCKFMGWTDSAQVPGALPLTNEAMAAMSFSYLRDEKTGFEKALWNCAQFKRAEPGQCMKPRALG